jgi:hypothetical protein
MYRFGTWLERLNLLRSMILQDKSMELSLLQDSIDPEYTLNKPSFHLMADIAQLDKIFQRLIQLDNSVLSDKGILALGR